MNALCIEVAGRATDELGLVPMLALVVAALIVCWIVLRLVLRETVRFSARLGPARRDPPSTSETAPTKGDGPGP